MLHYDCQPVFPEMEPRAYEMKTKGVRAVDERNKIRMLNQEIMLTKPACFPSGQFHLVIVKEPLTINAPPSLLVA